MAITGYLSVNIDGKPALSTRFLVPTEKGQTVKGTQREVGSDGEFVDLGRGVTPHLVNDTEWTKKRVSSSHASKKTFILENQNLAAGYHQRLSQKRKDEKKNS